MAQSHCRELLLSFTIILGFIGIALTQTTGEALQKYLDKLALDVEVLKSNQISPSRFHKLELALNNSIINNEFRFSDAEARLDLLEYDMSSLKGIVARIDADVGTLKTKVSTLEAKNKELEVHVGILKTEVERLGSVNQIWKKNFKIVNNTFEALRKKISFKVGG